MTFIKNPIIPGFNPDPSVIRVKNDYYLAVSTFEWFPGVTIYHSKDLINWKIAARPLSRVSQIDLRGKPSSCGVFAPCLSYCEGIFYLIYTDVKGGNSKFKDTHNYLVTTENILGEWSEPIYLNSSGFDPSLFHDTDGRKWLVNMSWNYSSDNPMDGILLQEYSEQQKKLIGPVTNIFKGSQIGGPEGPHLYKRGEYYYLITAEGGTGYNHAVSLARSKAIDGKYEMHPNNPVLTSANNINLSIQKAGHADLIETKGGEWYMVHLGSRPLPNTDRCALGRETCIQQVEWKDDGWLYISDGGNEPKTDVEITGSNKKQNQNNDFYVDFEGDDLSKEFLSLRVPIDEEYFSLGAREGHLRIRGRESIASNFEQSLLAVRQRDFCCEVSTKLEFAPASNKHLAGLACFYNTDNFYYLAVTYIEEQGKVITIIKNDSGETTFPARNGICINDNIPIYLKAIVKHGKLQFYYALGIDNWQAIGEKMDYSILSDDYGRENNTGWFTGTMLGICCQDMQSLKKYADFDYFRYKRLGDD